MLPVPGKRGCFFEEAVILGHRLAVNVKRAIPPPCNPFRHVLALIVRHPPKGLAKLLLCVCMCAAGAARSADKPLLFLGNHDIPPMIYLEETGPKGIVVDLARAIIDKAGLDATIEAIDWGTAQERLRAGSADALLQINSNPEREKVFDFSAPLLLSEFTLFRRSDRVELQGIESLQGRTVGVKRQSYPFNLLKNHPKVKVVIIPSWPVGFQRLSRGELDAILVDRWVGEFELSKLDITNVTGNTRPIESSYSAIAVRKGNDELLARINDGIEGIRADGTYDRILDSWKDLEVIHLTREQRFLYVTLFLLLLVLVIIGAGLLYVRRIRIENRLKSELNDRLESRNDELLQFAYRTSHDLKAPLTTSKRLLHFIAEDIESGNVAEALQNTQVVETQISRLENLIGNMLDMTSAEFLEQEVESINFGEVIREIQERFAWMPGEDTWSISLSDETNRPIRLPRARLLQIIENIVSNGIKYRDKAKPSSYVRITATNDASDLSLLIEDNGLGIPEAYQGRVFDMFQRFHPEAEDGSGLGLSIVRKHIRVLGGSVRLHSVEGEGSSFQIRIPLHG